MSDQVGLIAKRDQEDLSDYPEDVKADYAFLSAWLSELAATYRDRIRIELINVSSFRGFYKSIQYRTQTYPTFIVNGGEKYIGRDKSELDGILQRYVGRSQVGQPKCQPVGPST